MVSGGKLKDYLASFRLRTLPLSVSGILLGSLLARSAGSFRMSVFGLALLTTLCLQILSNVSNELGDMLKGTDNAGRVGPWRGLQTGRLTVAGFWRMIGIFTALSLAGGIALVGVAFGSLTSPASMTMLAVGGAAALAAVKYTLGKKPYGYRGLGDLFVFLFFGGVSTLGAYYLMTRQLPPALIWPAAAAGLLITGVLNVNNIRDMDNDARCGKRTLPVMLGKRNARFYHVFLIAGGFLCMLAYVLLTGGGDRRFCFLLTLPLFLVHLRAVFRYDGKALDPQLKFLSLSILLWAVLAGFTA